MNIINNLFSAFKKKRKKFRDKNVTKTELVLDIRIPFFDNIPNGLKNEIEIMMQTKADEIKFDLGLFMASKELFSSYSIEKQLLAKKYIKILNENIKLGKMDGKRIGYDLELDEQDMNSNQDSLFVKTKKSNKGITYH